MRTVTWFSYLDNSPTQMEILFIQRCKSELERTRKTCSDGSTVCSALDTYHVAAVAGNSAILPCDVTPPHVGELVYLVLWYKGDEGEPLYSYDSRQVGTTLQKILIKKMEFYC